MQTCFAVTLLAVAAAAPAPSERAVESIEAASMADMSQWVMNYYQKPDPENVPARVRRIAKLNMLRNGRPESNQMFLGQVMRANPDKIVGWMDSWKDLPAEDQVVLQQALWVSQTEQGKKWLTEKGLKELADKEGHPFTTNSPMVLEPYHVDVLWEWFFATGEKAPVEKLVGMFGMLPDDPGAADLPPKPEVGADRPTYLRKMIGGLSVWSTASLAVRHDRLLTLLKEIDGDPRLSPRSSAWLMRTILLAERDREGLKATAK
jgi:hypothetical protein